MRLLALLYYRESLHIIQPFSLTFAALPKLAQEELWDELSDDEQREAIQLLMDASEYVT